MSKYLKVMFGTNSGASDFEYKIGEVNNAIQWNPTAEKGRDFGGFNYTSEDCIIRWLHRGDTLYDVEVPKNAENIKIDGATTVYRTNKIIIRNPRKVDDDLALHFYEISSIPEKTYYKTLGVVSIMNYKKTALQILRDKVDKANILEVLEEWNDFINHAVSNDRKESNETVKMIDKMLNEIKSDLLISINVSKEPYIKQLTNDNIINLTDQSESGKTYYAKEHFTNNKYEVIDTDDIFSEKRCKESNRLNRELGRYFRKKYTTLPNLSDDFDLIYNEILSYCKNINKTIVIDCAQFHCCNDIRILKGKIIILRTDIDTCYKRTISRWIKNHTDYTEEDLNLYKKHKENIYMWYEGTNDFIKRIDSI